jgi:hypothetical protein
VRLRAVACVCVCLSARLRQGLYPSDRLGLCRRVRLMARSPRTTEATRFCSPLRACVRACSLDLNIPRPLVLLVRLSACDFVHELFCLLERCLQGFLNVWYKQMLAAPFFQPGQPCPWPFLPARGNCHRHQCAHSHALTRTRSRSAWCRRDAAGSGRRVPAAVQLPPRPHDLLPALLVAQVPTTRQYASGRTPPPPPPTLLPVHIHTLPPAWSG